RTAGQVPANMMAPNRPFFSVLGLYLKVNPFIWNSGTVGSTAIFPLVTIACIMGAEGVTERGTLSKIIVRSSAVSLIEFTVVCPINVIGLLITRVLVQVAVPAGTITVSPFAAEATALLTSAKEGLGALMVAACTAPETAKRGAAKRAPNLPTTERHGWKRVA